MHEPLNFTTATFTLLLSLLFGHSLPPSYHRSRDFCLPTLVWQVCTGSAVWTKTKTTKKERRKRRRDGGNWTLPRRQPRPPRARGTSVGGVSHLAIAHTSTATGGRNLVRLPLPRHQPEQVNANTTLTDGLLPNLQSLFVNGQTHALSLARS